MSDRVAIIGIGWSGFRAVTPEYSYKELMYEAARRAYFDAGVDPRPRAGARLRPGRTPESGNPAT